MTGRTARRSGYWRPASTIVVVFVAAVVAGALAPHSATALLGDPLEPPSRSFLLGTNNVGQDLASQLLVGARTSLLIAVTSAAAAVTFGVTVGIGASMSGPRAERVVMRGVDLFLAVPRLPLLIVLGMYIGTSSLSTALVIASVMWPITARVTRGRLTGIRRSGHLLASRGFGARRRHIVRRHLIPEIAPVAFSTAVVIASRAVVMESGLALLGIGDVSRTSWGATVRDALDFRNLFRTTAWRWWLVPPVVAVSVVTGMLTLAGERLERTDRGRV